MKHVLLQVFYPINYFVSYYMFVLLAGGYVLLPRGVRGEEDISAGRYVLLSSLQLVELQTCPGKYNWTPSYWPVAIPPLTSDLRICLIK